MCVSGDVARPVCQNFRDIDVELKVGCPNATFVNQGQAPTWMDEAAVMVRG